MMVITHISFLIPVKFPCGLTASSSRSLLDLDLESDELCNTGHNITVRSLPTTTTSNLSSSNESQWLSLGNETVRTQPMGTPPATMSTQNLTGIENDTKSDRSLDDSGPFNNTEANMNHTIRRDSGSAYGNTESLPEDEHSRIVGGMLCELGQCPWQVCYTLSTMICLKYPKELCNFKMNLFLMNIC